MVWQKAMGFGAEFWEKRIFFNCFVVAMYIMDLEKGKMVLMNKKVQIMVVGTQKKRKGRVRQGKARQSKTKQNGGGGYGMDIAANSFKV